MSIRRFIFHLILAIIFCCTAIIGPVIIDALMVGVLVIIELIAILVLFVPFAGTFLFRITGIDGLADDGIGVRKSLSENENYRGISEEEAIRICVKDAITDGKGMGFGLYSTSLLARDAGLRFEVRSGEHTLTVHNGNEKICKIKFGRKYD